LRTTKHLVNLLFFTSSSALCSSIDPWRCTPAPTCPCPSIASPARVGARGRPPRILAWIVGEEGGPTALFELERSRPESRLMVPASEIRRSRREGPDWEGTRRRDGVGRGGDGRERARLYRGRRCRRLSEVIAFDRGLVCCACSVRYQLGCERESIGKCELVYSDAADVSKRIQQGQRLQIQRLTP
jgi:hypothetical protein